MIHLKEVDIYLYMYTQMYLCTYTEKYIHYAVLNLCLIFMCITYKHICTYIFLFKQLKFNKNLMVIELYISFSFPRTFYSIILILLICAKLIHIIINTKSARDDKIATVLKSKTTQFKWLLTEFTTEFNNLNASKKP